jgi:hypothetical protein
MLSPVPTTGDPIMSFRITGLEPNQFAPLFELPDAALAAHGARRRIADAPRGFPCRVSLADAAPGEELLLVNFEHQPAATPYRARHAIYVRRIAAARFDRVDRLPDFFAGRILSLRAFDSGHMIGDAALAPGDDAAPAIERLLAIPGVAYIQAHFAAYGCYAARIERA